MRNSENKRIYGTKGIAQLLHIVTKPALSKRGFAENKILTDWQLIVGAAIGMNSSPSKLDFYRDKRSEGTLHIEVYDSGLAMELTYMEPVIIEKIATYFGYKAVSRLRITQKPGGSPYQQDSESVTKRVISNEKSSLIDNMLDGFDDEIKQALSSLGRNVMAEPVANN